MYIDIKGKYAENVDKLLLKAVSKAKDATDETRMNALVEARAIIKVHTVITL